MAMKLVDAEQLEADLTSVADKIRAKTGGEDALAFPSGFVDALDTIESADSALAEVEAIQTVDSSGNSYKNYSFMFYGMKLMEEVPMQMLKHISNGENFDSMFYLCRSLVTIPSLDTSSGTSFREMFYNLTKLESIEGINLSSATDAIFLYNMFYSSTKLQNIIFNGVIKATGLDLSSCKNLTHDSLMSAINALYDWASEGTTGTFKLTLGSTNLAKLTDAEKAIATQRGWTLT